MKLAFIETYPPRECGIGTFTRNLTQSMLGFDKQGAPQNEVLVVAMDDHNQKYAYPPEVKLSIR